MITTDPLTSTDITRWGRDRTPASAASSWVTRPLALREMRSAPRRDLPTYVYDPVLQVAVDENGLPVAGKKGKEWTSYESTHTDGDGGDNETWGWEEQ